VCVCVCVREREREREREKGRLRFVADKWFSSIYYGVATISRLLKITGLLRRISILLWGSFAKETYNFKEPTNRSHPILNLLLTLLRSTVTIAATQSWR